jgi:hypothetical protein
VTADDESISRKPLERFLDHVVYGPSLQGRSREEHPGMNEVRTVRVSFRYWHRFVVAREIDEDVGKSQRTSTTENDRFYRVIDGN